MRRFKRLRRFKIRSKRGKRRFNRIRSYRVSRGGIRL